MKATARRDYGSKLGIDLACQIANKLTEMATDLTTCECLGDVCTCSARYTTGSVECKNGAMEIEYCPDHYGASVSARWDGRVLEVETTTCGGHRHELVVNSEEGNIIVSHEGARSSFPGTLLDILPGSWFGINQAHNWRLVGKVETTEPAWAVPIGLLAGKFGEGPTCLAEEENQE